MDSPVLPAPTCPTIDEIIVLLEKLRLDNSQLRMGALHFEALYKEARGILADCRELITDNDGNLCITMFNKYWEDVGTRTLTAINGHIGS